VQEDLVLCTCDMNSRTATPTSTQANGLENGDSGIRNGNLSDSWNKKRIIIHVDLNSFYPSCEELRQPSLLGKPHAVIMTHEEQGHITKGVVASCSYEAKKMGVKSATSLSSALRICPNLILNRVDIPYYVSISQRIMNILYRYSDILEQTSIDEAYLDCTDKIYAQVLQKDQASEANNLSLSSRSFKNNSNTSSNVSSSRLVEKLAISIKNKIKKECGLLTSVGVAPTKSIAKIASDFRKPDGLTIVLPSDISIFLENLEVDSISGIGAKTKRSLKQMGIETIGQLAKTDVQTLVYRFGNKVGIRMWKIAKGQDEAPVRPRGDHVSLSTEHTLHSFTTDQEELLAHLNALIDELYSRIQKRGYRFRTVGVRLVHADFTVETRERSYSRHQDTIQCISDAIPGLLQKFYSPAREKQEIEGDIDKAEEMSSNNKVKLATDVPIRKIGIRISNMIRKEGIGRSADQSSILDYL
jgi:DNA polymerase IV (archaeal DinB-like DNA polymerase)